MIYLLYIIILLLLYIIYRPLSDKVLSKITEITNSFIEIQALEIEILKKLIHINKEIRYCAIKVDKIDFEINSLRHSLNLDESYTYDRKNNRFFELWMEGRIQPYEISSNEYIRKKMGN